MARNTHLICDVCRKETGKIVAKIHYIPSVDAPAKHSNYTHHCDVGECCGVKVLKLLNFRPRVTADQYHESRRKAS